MRCKRERTVRDAEVKVGRGTPWAVPLINMLSQRIMMELGLIVDPISARRGYGLGLVNAVVAPADLLRVALDLVERIARNAPSSQFVWKPL